MTIWILIFILSVLLNITLAWYVYKVLSKLLYTADNFGDLYIVFRMYEKFCDSLYEMDMFSGEPVIKELIDKTKFVRAELERFEDIYGLTTDIELFEEEMDDDESQEETRQEA